MKKSTQFKNKPRWRMEILDYEVYPAGFGPGSGLDRLYARTAARARRICMTLGAGASFSRGIRKRRRNGRYSSFAIRHWIWTGAYFINTPEVKKAAQWQLSNAHLGYGRGLARVLQEKYAAMRKRAVNTGYTLIEVAQR